ncbi:MAG TPA: MMPL family transporter [Gemmataceae bacterium]|nr:MMPL family transporter [Gemmataceae bacterium]
MNPAQAPPHEAGLIRRGLLALVGAVCRFPRTVLALSAVLCAASLYGAIFHLQYRTQRDDLISPRKECQQRWRNYIQEFGDDDDIVAVVRGADRGRMIAALERIADRVRAQPALFDRLFYKADLRGLHDRALLMLPLAEIEKIRRNLNGDMSPLLTTNVDPNNYFYPWRRLTLLSLLIKGRNTLPDGRALDPDEVQFYAQLRAVARTAVAYLDDPHSYSNPWSQMGGGPAGQEEQLTEPQYFFSGAGGLAFLLARPKKEQGSFTAALKSVAAMRGVVADVRTTFPDLEFGLTGMPVLETDEMASAQRDTQWASWLAVAGVAVLFLVVYRGVAYPTLTLVTLLVGTAWALGWLTLTVGHLNILSATFAVMLIGMGDYGVLWVMRYEQARRQGADVRTALLHTTTHVAVGNLTAAMTLALAFYAAVLADFQAVAELGWIAGCGVLLCAFACFTVLPSLLMLFDRRKIVLCRLSVVRCEQANGPRTTDHGPRTTDNSWLPLLSRRPWWVTAGGVALLAGLGICVSRVRYDHNLLHLQAQDLESVRWEMTLIRETAGASWHALSIADSPEKALELKAKYEQLPEVSRVVEMATLVPPGQDKKLPLLADIQDRLQHLPERNKAIEHDPPVGRVLRTELSQFLQGLSQTAPSPRETDRALIADLPPLLRGLLDRLPPEKDDETGQTLKGFEEKLAGDLSADLHKLRDVSSPKPILLSDLPTELRERYVSPHGKWLLRVFAKDCLWDFGPLEHFTEQVRKVDPAATGKPFGTVEGLKAMKDGLQRAGLYAFLVIAAVLFCDFRSLRNTLIALAPLVMGVTLTLGILGLFGVPLNPANMIAFPLILGVGVDNGVHVLHDYLIRRAEGRSTISHAIGRGVMVKALTAMIGFGTLMISSERGLAGLGLILTLGVGCSMLSALVFLPAVLHLLGGRKKAADARPAAPPVEALRQAA